MLGFVDEMRAQEGRDHILSVSLGHGFPWGDVADAGAKLWVVADGSPALAQAAADRLGQVFYRIRHAGVRSVLTVDEAIDAAQGQEHGPVVLADVADNPGGGAAGDSTFILTRLVERGVRDVVSGCYWDPVAVQHCLEAGCGARLMLRIGGKTGPASGRPVDLDVTVRAVDPQHVQTGLGGHLDPLGAAAWVSTDGIDLVLVSLRSQVYSRDAFSRLGVDPAQRRIVVVKSTQHFLADFGRIAARVYYVSTPGAVAPDFARIPYRRRSLDFWPRLADPLGLDAPTTPH
jgi:microcystin degradation protein MlrC